MPPPDENDRVPICRHDAVDLLLMRYGELPDDRAAEVADRLASCTTCADEYARLDAVFKLAAPEPFIPDSSRAADARASALAEIGRRSMRVRVFGWRSMWHRLAESGSAATRWAPRLAVATLLIVAGYLAGRTSPATVTNTEYITETAFDVRDIRVDPVTGEFVIRYSVPESATLVGTLGDRSVSRSLVRALGEDDDARVRLHALRALHEAPGLATRDPELVAAVVAVLSSNSGDPLRLRAVEALGALYDESTLDEPVRRALLDVLLSDAGDGVRVAALDVLVSREPVESDLERLIEIARTDANPYVRLQATDAVNRLGKAVPLESLP